MHWRQSRALNSAIKIILPVKGRTSPLLCPVTDRRMKTTVRPALPEGGVTLLFISTQEMDSFSPGSAPGSLILSRLKAKANLSLGVTTESFKMGHWTGQVINFLSKHDTLSQKSELWVGSKECREGNRWLPIIWSSLFPWLKEKKEETKWKKESISTVFLILYCTHKQMGNVTETEGEWWCNPYRMIILLRAFQATPGVPRGNSKWVFIGVTCTKGGGRVSQIYTRKDSFQIRKIRLRSAFHT